MRQTIQNWSRPFDDGELNVVGQDRPSVINDLVMLYM